LVVDVFNLLDAELANFLASEELAPAAALARRTTGPSSATTATKPRTISPRARPFAGTRPLARRCLLWCFRFVSHISPSESLCQACLYPHSVVSGQQSVVRLLPTPDS